MRIKIFIKSFFVCLGVISAVFTIAGLIWATKISTLISEYQYSQCYISIAVFIIALLYAIMKIWKKEKLSLNIAKKLRTNIYYGDLFKVSGIIVIPVNEYFDTIVDDKII
jgi:ABC-type transport system involved in cytochrome bd biosynthesis fused ATPase/permease subunit